jgi:hypothetical protein
MIELGPQIALYRRPQQTNTDDTGHRTHAQKETPRRCGAFHQYFPAATYSPTPQGCSTIGPEGLSCRVRNGIGRFPHGMATGKNLQPKPSIISKQAREKVKK